MPQPGKKSLFFPVFSISTAFVLALCSTAAVASLIEAPDEEAKLRRDIIASMKRSAKGPFDAIRWFCNDGSELPPEPYACRSHGGGVQHGRWSAATRALRENGFRIATILASTELSDLVSVTNTAEGPVADYAALTDVLVERFLVAADDGWILRRARYYRGAYQVEQEAASAKRLILELLDQPTLTDHHYLLLHEAVARLPHAQESQLLTRVRGQATTLANADPRFEPLRNKIHGQPDASDSDKVRQYADNYVPADQQAAYQKLANDIDSAWLPPDLSIRVDDFRRLWGDAPNLSSSRAPLDLLVSAAVVAKWSRERVFRVDDPGLRFDLLKLAVDAERAAFLAGRDWFAQAIPFTRRAGLRMLRANIDALYGSGLLTAFENAQLRDVLDYLQNAELSRAQWRSELAWLAKVIPWSEARIQRFFSDAVARFTQIEPEAIHFIPDRLRGSPMLFHAELLERMRADADAAVGLQHEVFEAVPPGGVQGLNAGLARGVLRFSEQRRVPKNVQPNSILVVPETVPYMPPVAGIVTASSGNLLSHVQLLARNLGVPNVVLSDQWLERARSYANKKVVLAVSPGGVVNLSLDSRRWEPVFEQTKGSGPVPIVPDLKKLDLSELDLKTLDEISAADSGRIVGPKAAKLAELRRLFPGKVSQGLVVPFGVFAQLLDTVRGPLEGARDVSMRGWMREQYSAMQGLSNTPAIKRRYRDRYLKSVRGWIEGQPLRHELLDALWLKMGEAFGEPGSYGVFVRSDTNIEDLPNFSGAGLNRTVPNVVGFEPIAGAIRSVWASPFTERAFGWRQAMMQEPEHVYPAVLLHQTIDSEKSGVMVTADLASGDRGFFTVVTSWGVGGGVDGQRAETLRVDANNGSVRLLSSAVEPVMKRAASVGGVKTLPAPLSERVLSADEIAQLAELHQALPGKFPDMVDDNGQPLPADIEFGFVAGQLVLFQIRPFIDNPRARNNEFLRAMDRGLISASQKADLEQIVP